jgi:hypothetical protein
VRGFGHAWKVCAVKYELSAEDEALVTCAPAIACFNQMNRCHKYVSPAEAGRRFTSSTFHAHTGHLQAVDDARTRTQQIDRSQHYTPLGPGVVVLFLSGITTGSCHLNKDEAFGPLAILDSNIHSGEKYFFLLKTTGRSERS